MTTVRSQLTNLDTAIAEVHPLLEAWSREIARELPVEETPLYRMRLAVHEWVANLIQHADWGGRQPRIELRLSLDEHEVHGVIEDNSAGFDFGRQLEQQRAKLDAERLAERGRGLLIMLDGTDNLRYFPLPAAPPTGEPRQRLEFWISVTPQPCLNIPS